MIHMKIASLPTVLLAGALLCFAGCSSGTTKLTPQNSDPEVSLFSDITGGGDLIRTEDSGSISLVLEFDEILVEDMTITITGTGSAAVDTDYVLQAGGDPFVVEASDLTFNAGRGVHQAVLTNYVTLLNNSNAGDDNRTLQLTITEVSYGTRAIPVSVVITINNDGDVSTKPTSN